MLRQTWILDTSLLDFLDKYSLLLILDYFGRSAQTSEIAISGKRGLKYQVTEIWRCRLVNYATTIFGWRQNWPLKSNVLKTLGNFPASSIWWSTRVVKV